MKLTIDFETRSRSSIGSEGPWKYAEDPTTEVLCLAIKIDDKPARIWSPDKFRAIVSNPILTRQADTPWIELKTIYALLRESNLVIEAHNLEFERAIWTHVMVPRYQAPPLPLDKCSCTAARAAYLAIPRDLAHACLVVGASAKKDEAGHRLMLQMCKPRAATKKEQKPNGAKDRVLWHEQPWQLEQLFRYCLQDVEAEYALSQRLPELPAEERRIWLLDQECNGRGVRIDLDNVKRMLVFYADYQQRLVAELRDLTGGEVTEGMQVAKMLAWLKTQGLDLPSLTGDEVGTALRRQDLSPPVRRLLELRRSLSRSSVAKYRAMLKRASADGRARSLLMYHGASTGRWTGKAIQVQNLPRGQFADIDACLGMLRSKKTWPLIEEWWCDPADAAATCIRGMLVPSLGKDFLAADFSAIEGRVLAWLAGEQTILANYRNGLDPYKVNASRTYQVCYAEVTKDQRQVGKVQELALGYGGGIGAFASMGRNYHLESSELELMLPELMRKSTEEQVFKAREMATTYLRREAESKLSFDAAVACDLAKQLWRSNRQATTQYWRDLEQATIRAVSEPGTKVGVRHCLFCMKRDFLACRLPSGRVIWYCDPHLEDRPTPWGETKATLRYWAVESETRKWCVQHTYGGKLAENITQAVARDLLRDAMLRLDRSVYSLAFHVHDEIIVEADEGKGDVNAFCAAMAETPAWAEGLPVSAKGWRGKRYRKG